MRKQYTIQVRRLLNGSKTYRHPNEGKFLVIETIKRVIRAEQIGNFNPLFCTYNRDNRCLVKSEAGDVSDPFRREESYANTFYIEVRPASKEELEAELTALEKAMSISDTPKNAAKRTPEMLQQRYAMSERAIAIRAELQSLSTNPSPDSPAST